MTCSKTNKFALIALAATALCVMPAEAGLGRLRPLGRAFLQTIRSGVHGAAHFPFRGYRNVIMPGIPSCHGPQRVQHSSYATTLDDQRLINQKQQNYRNEADGYQRQINGYTEQIIKVNQGIQDLQDKADGRRRFSPLRWIDRHKAKKIARNERNPLQQKVRELNDNLIAAKRSYEIWTSSDNYAYLDATEKAEHKQQEGNKLKHEAQVALRRHHTMRKRAKRKRGDALFPNALVAHMCLDDDGDYTFGVIAYCATQMEASSADRKADRNHREYKKLTRKAEAAFAKAERYRTLAQEALEEEAE